MKFKILYNKFYPCPQQKWKGGIYETEIESEDRNSAIMKATYQIGIEIFVLVSCEQL